MKYVLTVLITLYSTHINANDILSITLKDGEIIQGKLWLPQSDNPINKLVIFIHGTGPNTFLNRRKGGDKEFDYYGYFAEEFIKRGIAFFSYNRRGVDTVSVTPFERIDRGKFNKYIPETEADDVSAIITFLKKKKKLRKAKFILLGWSEGSIIAPMVAEKKRNKVSALFLAGYVNERMDSVIRWQFSGEPSMLSLRKYFDSDSNFVITRQEYESETNKATQYRTKVLKNAKFEQLDVNIDSLIDKRDFKILAWPVYIALMEAYERQDEEWIWNNYFKITIGWMRQHFSLEANKERLLRINIPIYIFHGDTDANCDINGVYKIAEIFNINNKQNLKYFIFNDHDHNLNFTRWVREDKIPNGILKIFDEVEKL